MRLLLLAAVLICFAGCGSETEISQPEEFAPPAEPATVGSGDGNGGVSAPPMVE